MVGKILIVGQIGTFSDGAGNTVKGVELVDVIEQVNAQPGRETYEIWINSEGGSVEVGEAIGKYISSLPNATTIAHTLCASIATHVHLAVPLANRKIVEGTVYMIHNPLVTGVTGNSEDLKLLAEWLKPKEESMIKMYMKATGQTKEAISLLMKGETEFTPEQCVTFGFASSVINEFGSPSEIQKQYKAVAFLNKQTIETMSFKDSYNNALAKLKSMNLLNSAGAPEGGGTPPPTGPVRIAMITENRTALAIKVTSKDDVVYVTPFEDGILPGDSITTEDGKPLEAGDVELKDGTILVVMADETGSWVAEVKPPAGGTAEEMVALLKKENEDLKAQLAEQETSFKEVSDQVEILAKKMTGSTYIPPVSVVAFRPQGAVKVEEKSLAEQAKEAEARYKK